MSVTYNVAFVLENKDTSVYKYVCRYLRLILTCTRVVLCLLKCNMNMKYIRGPEIYFVKFPLLHSQRGRNKYGPKKCLQHNALRIFIFHLTGIKYLQSM